MNTNLLKKFAQSARRHLIAEIAARLEWVLTADSIELREKERAVKELRDKINKTSKKMVIEQIAYTWFNRFCALRFMDVNNYTRMGVVSPSSGFTQPEILQDAKQGHIDSSLEKFVVKRKIFDLLNGKTPSSDPQGEAYRLLIVAVCNYYNSIMPFMFEKIDDYTELLMPEDLLSDHSIINDVRKALTADSCKDVEVIGWLYQFYISEKKDEIFKKLKKRKKILPEEIPAATQLFTPHWIVRYLVENSLGRLWMLNHSDSPLVQEMDYYIKPEKYEEDFLKISSPEEIKICDPACGSGHMLVYAFDLLYAIYEKEGYQAAEITKIILQKNLYGIEIDERAGELAAFALAMKARKKNKDFFQKPVQPNICVLKNISFEEEELDKYMDKIGRDLFTSNLQTTLCQFEETDNFGSLIRPAVTDVADTLQTLEQKEILDDMFLNKTHQKVLKVLEQADYLSQKYHVVIANPPYMGGKGMNARLKAFAKDKYKDSKSDLFAMFIERNLELAEKKGSIAMITMQSWMFLSSFEDLRSNILNNNTILSMAHLGARAFDSIGGAVVSTTAFVIENSRKHEYKGAYLRLIDGKCEAEKEAALKIKCSDPFYASATEFKKIPGSPIAYWVSEKAREAFGVVSLIDKATFRAGLQTGKNDIFLRYWHEVSYRNFMPGCKSRAESILSGKRWFPHNKGGSFRKWHGNEEYSINWENDGHDIKERKLKDLEAGKITANNSKCWNQDFYFKDGLTWSSLSSSDFSLRDNGFGFLFDTKGQMLFPTSTSDKNYLLGLLNSTVAYYFLAALSPTLDFNGGIVSKLPLIPVQTTSFLYIQGLVLISQSDWDSYETSWDFTDLPILRSDYRKETLKETYQTLRSHWNEMTLEMKRLEEENNRIFIDAYGLQDELTPDVPLKEITLTCNPYYRYKGNKTEEELETLLLSDTLKEYISYAVGCMFGRYSLDKPGLVLANQGETIEDYLTKVPDSSFTADDDNVIPVLDEGWFTDDITGRFYKFLKVTFGEEKFEENLMFIEDSLDPKTGKKLTVRKYFLNMFYNDHVKRYKKRPIYWLFSSPKSSFQALIYMHRYRSDTVSVVLNDYLREYQTKLNARKDHLDHVSKSDISNKQEKIKAFKEVEKLKNTILELETYQRDILYPLATNKVEIDLDDGVKVNYPKFGKAIKKVNGLSL